MAEKNTPINGNTEVAPPPPNAPEASIPGTATDSQPAKSELKIPLTDFQKYLFVEAQGLNHAIGAMGRALRSVEKQLWDEIRKVNPELSEQPLIIQEVDTEPFITELSA